jgi:two-component system chemotaxis sensor kinase CheA
MGGTISLESREGEGSRFSLTVPADVDAAGIGEQDGDVRYTSFSEETSEPDAEPAESPGAGKAQADTDCRHTGRVLVVDDDERSVFALRCILEEQDYCVLSAENGREAMEALEGRADVDLVLMDIMMPEMDGYEAIREIRGREEWKEIPVIAVTAKAMKTDRMKCLDAGASDYMAKPVDPTALLALVQRWLDRDATEMSA